MSGVKSKKFKENGITIEEPEWGNLTEKLDELYNNLALKYNNGKKSFLIHIFLVD